MIRELKASDVYTCVKIVEKNWGEKVGYRFNTEIRHAFNNTMSWPPKYFVWDGPYGVVGFAGMIPSWRMHGIWDFIWINVHPEFQKSGIGKALTQHRIDQVKLHDGAVIDLVTKQIGFFRKFGFRYLKTYDGGWSAMTLQLKDMEL